MAWEGRRQGEREIKRRETKRKLKNWPVAEFFFFSFLLFTSVSFSFYLATTNNSFHSSSLLVFGSEIEQEKKRKQNK